MDVTICNERFCQAQRRIVAACATDPQTHLSMLHYGRAMLYVAAAINAPSCDFTMDDTSRLSPTIC